jgi:Uncharacterized conserved protein
MINKEIEFHVNKKVEEVMEIINDPNNLKKMIGEIEYVREVERDVYEVKLNLIFSLVFRVKKELENGVKYSVISNTINFSILHKVFDEKGGSRVVVKINYEGPLEPLVNKFLDEKLEGIKSKFPY